VTCGTRVQVEKHTKSKKSTYATIELFTLKSKSGEVTNDLLELPNKNDKVLQVAWEPKGHRFSVIHAEQPGRVNVSFYSMLDKSVKESAKLLGTIANRREMFCVSRAPQQLHCVWAHRALCCCA
jgi:translation initiation factor 3 subunit B